MLWFVIISFSSFAQINTDYDNPFMAGPAIFYRKGAYYLYGTGNKDDSFKVFTPTDKINRADKGYVLKKANPLVPKVFELRRFLNITINSTLLTQLPGIFQTKKLLKEKPQ